ncbi:MAG: T9SS type A sorting domain-containing protein [Saprospiraceae bacterium]|nr:T9SS type A sorting domain-containing protein [Candidatus Defluviibacterium haderslevense]
MKTNIILTIKNFLHENNKYIFIFSINLILNLNLKSQVCFNEGFENCTCYSSTSFFDGCVPQWINTHGSACNDIAGEFNTGSHAAHVYSLYRVNCAPKRIGEGMALNYNFFQGQNYKITYFIKRDLWIGKLPGIFTHAWILPSISLPNKPNGTYQNCHPNVIVPDIPPLSDVLVPPLPFTNIGSWTQIEISFTPTMNFTQLWFRCITDPEENSDPVPDRGNHVYVDDITIECIMPFCNLCQPNQSQINLTNPNFTKLSEYGLNTIPTGSCVSIAGRLEIDINNIQFDNCNVYLEPGAEIYLNPGLNLSSIGSTFRGCSQMWKSITIPNGSSFNCKSSYIYDARKGIHSIGNTTLNLFNNHFYNDEIGIYAEGGIVNTPSFMEENVFESISPGFLPNYGGAPTPGIGKAGIESLNATIQIGGDFEDGPENYFINLTNGIFATTSKVSVFNAQFTNMVPILTGSQGATIPNGMAIYGKQSYIDANWNNIDFAKTAIFLKTCNRAVTNHNMINHVGHGIIEQDGFKVILANNNNITYSSNGIEVSQPRIINQFEISSNTLLSVVNSVSNSSQFGIVVSGLKHITQKSSKPTIYSKIQHNVINHNDNGFGIVLTNCEFVGLQDNTFSFSYVRKIYDPMGFTGDFSGISLFSTKSSIIFNNHVFGNNPNPTTITRGFSINGSSNNKYCINDCNNSKEGFAIAGTCTSNNLFRSNNIQNHDRGLYVFDKSVLGIQEYLGNQWSGSYSTKAAINGNSSGLERVKSQFTINTCNSPQWPVSISPNQGCFDDASLWFRLRMEGVNNIACAAPFPIPINPVPSDDDNLNDNDIWTAQGQFGSYSPMVFEMSTDLFTKLKANPNLLGVNTSVDSFFAMNSSTNIYKFYRLDSAIHEFLTLKGIHYEMIYALDSTISVMQNSIRQLDSIYNIANTELERTNIATQKYNLILQQLVLINQSDSTLNLINAEKSELLLSIQSWNNEIIPIGIVEQNRRTAHEVFIATILHGIDTLDSVQISQVEPIANQCFLTGGRGVLMARELMRMIGNNQFDDDMLCSPPQPIILEVDDIPESGYSVRPNPSIGNFIVHCPADQKGNIISMILTDLEGNQMLRQKVQINSELQIELNLNNSIPSGIYLIQLYNHKKKLYSDKIIILDLK